MGGHPAPPHAFILQNCVDAQPQINNILEEWQNELSYKVVNWIVMYKYSSLLDIFSSVLKVTGDSFAIS